MNHRRLFAAAAIIALILIIGFVLSVPHTHDAALKKAAAVVPAAPAVTLQDSFKKGVHTLKGSVAVADACTFVTADATLQGGASSTPSILLALSVPADSGICLDVPTDAPFSTTIAAPQHTPILVVVNGVVASTSTP